MKQFQRLVNIFLAIPPVVRRIPCHGRQRFIFTHIRRHVLGDIHQYRARPAASRDLERFAKRIRQYIHIFYDIAMFGNRHGNAGDIYFLKRIFA